MNIPITRPWLDNEEADAVADVLATGWVSQGPRVEEFEQVFADYVGARHAVATTSCTTALHLALLALGIGEGDEVLVPAFTFVASANAVEYCGARPVFVDIDIRTFNIDPRRIEQQISPKTRAIMPVHLFGLPAAMDEILEIARAGDLKVIEDAACAIGSRCDGTHVGPLGDAGCFSFHPRKIITTGEGGMLVTDDSRIAARAESLRSHGASVSDLQRHTANGTTLPAFSEIGFNYRMTDIQAAVGLAQMSKLNVILEKRREVAAAYDQLLAEFDWLETAPSSPDISHPYQSYVVRVKETAPLTRDEVASALAAEGISTRQGTHAVHSLECYRSRYSLQLDDCPEAWRADQTSLAIPVFPSMKSGDVERVVEALRKAATKIRRATAIGN